MIEKEYKFLIDKIPKDFNEKQKISQYYFDKEISKKYIKKFFSLNKEKFEKINQVRVRIVEYNYLTKYFLTLKTDGLLEREEYEKEITENDAELFLKLPFLKRLYKYRYILYINDIYKLEIDEFENNLKLCEAEVKNKYFRYDELINILANKLNLKFKDITMDEKYKNYNLAKAV